MKTKSIIYAVAALTICGFSLASCTASSENLKGSDITKLYNEQQKEVATDQFFHDICVGLYEIQPSDYCTLKKLEACGLIEFKTTRYCWWEQVWDSETYSYNFDDHVIADIKLTSKGKRLSVKKLPEAHNPMAADKIDETKLPEYGVINEWPFEQLPNPFLKQDDQNEISEEEIMAAEGEMEQWMEAHTQRNDAKLYEEYYALLPTLHRDTIHMEAYRMKAVKARNISLKKDENGISTASAELIIETQDVSPIGRIFFNQTEGSKTLKNISLVYYDQEGWEIADENDLFSNSVKEVVGKAVEFVEDVEEDFFDF